MTTVAPNGPDTVTANVEFSAGGCRLQAELAVPTGPTRLIDLLPVFQAVDDALTELVVREVEEKGESISCKKGCGACCRQVVPLSEVEARRIRDLVSELPEPRRSEVRARFAEAHRRLENAGLLEPLRECTQWTEEEGQRRGSDYFLQGIPCPFLEEESCSIHPDRPLSCREYLVTSPAEHCARPSAEAVKRARFPLKVWTAVARFDEMRPGASCVPWVPLILGPEWADTHPDEPPPRPGTELVSEFFSRLAGNAESRDR